MKKTIQNTRQNAFTLIELLVVLVVISILVAITIPVAKYVSYRAREAQYEVQMAKIKNALEDYRAKYGEYPITPVYETYNDNGTTNFEAQSPDDYWRHYPREYDTLCVETLSNYPNAPTDYIKVNNNTSTNWPTIEVIEGLLVDYALTYPLILKPLDNGETPYLGDGEETLLTVVSLITEHARTKDGRHEDITFYVPKKDGSRRPVTGVRYFGWPINRHYIIDPRNARQIKYTSNGLNYSITNW